MKTIGIFLFAFLFGAGLFAQKKVDLLGTVTDTTGTPLPGATVVLMQAKDSVLAQFGITANDGRFILRKVPAGNYLLQVTYVGYDMFFKPVALTGDSSEVQLGQLPLRPATSTLETVEVTAEHIPMRIVGDTIEYNADAFKTQPGAVVEDLLKKMPGLEVEPDGTIKAQGQKVENVLVEGKEFFGKDPTIATKNLPAEAIDKVQVFDKKSEQAEFTGIDDGNEERTINLQLKEDKKRGTFGNVSLGGGALYTPEGNYDFDRYEGRFMVNHFNSNTQLSFIGGLNNINESIFGFDDYMSFLGGPSNMGSTMIFDSDAFDSEIMGTFLGTSDGLNAMRGAGVNLNKEFGPSFLGQKTTLYFSYFFNHNQNTTDLASRRENIVENESFSETLSSLSETVNMGHRFSLTLRHELDSSQHLLVKSNLQLREGEFDKAASRFAFDAVNSSQSLSRSGANSDVLRHFTLLNYRKKFSRPGRTVFVNAELGNNDRENLANLFNTLVQISHGSTTQLSDTTDQRQVFNQDASDYSASMTWTEPVGKGKTIGLGLMRNNFDDLTSKDFFDRLPAGTELFNDSLSIRFNRGYVYDRAKLSFTLNKGGLSLTASTALQRSQLDGQRNDESPLERKYIRLLPSLSVRFNNSKGSSLRFSYDTNLQEPSIEQLQPVVDNSDPLSIYIGNPDLQPSYQHNLSVNYNLFDKFSSTILYASAFLTFTQDPIVNATRVDEFFVRTIEPVNTDESVSLYSNLYFSTPLRKLGVNLNVNLFPSFRRNTLFVNDTENRSTTLQQSIRVTINNLKTDFIEARIGGSFTFNKTTYSVSTELNRTYNNQNLNVSLTLTPTEKWSFNSKFSHTWYPGTSFSQSDRIALWDISLSRSFTPSNRFLLRLSAKDLLNQNLSIQRSATLNYLFEERVRSLGRHVMLTLTYKISGFGNNDSGSVLIIED